jgi:nitrous oxide reductase accessory protein NosL
LYFQQGRDDVVLVEVADFRTSKLMDATQAIYVEDSSVNMCYLDSPVHRHIEGIESTLAWDRCMPGLLAFESREAAEEFRNEKGGFLKTYLQLLEEAL